MIYGYAGKILRVDLTTGSINQEALPEGVLRQYLGGTALGTKFLFDEVAPGTEWSSPQNRLFIGSGPLGGTKVGGSGSISVVTKGALTNGAAATQANGFFGAYLRFCGFDAIIIQGAAPDWVYLHISEGKAVLRDARRLLGQDTYRTEALVKEELQKPAMQSSVLCIGPAGENLVKFAMVAADIGHVAGHNGVGAVMGSKKLKAVAVERGKFAVPLKEADKLSDLAARIRETTLRNKMYQRVSVEGTVGGVERNIKTVLPIKNYTTSIFNIAPDKLSTYTAAYIRPQFKAKHKACWACQWQHLSMLEIPEGQSTDLVEEPEFEGMSAWSLQVGVTNVTDTIRLATAADRLGLDTNEASWVIGWVMECCEKGLLKRQDTDGLDMTWGNAAAARAMLERIAARQGFGNVLAEGVMRAARQTGAAAENLAVHTRKGNTPRGHDHRASWLEMFDTCVSNTGTLETQSAPPFDQLGMSASFDAFDPQAISTVEAKIKGAMIFEDSVVTCRYNTATNLNLLCQAINAATGWDLNVAEAMQIGRRCVNMLRVFNLRHGIGGELDAPSPRYGSTPIDGLFAGRAIMPHWNGMLQNYYRLMGWDEKGRPLPETLRGLGLEGLIGQLPS